MKFHLDTYYKNQDEAGNCIACLDLHFEHAQPEVRDRICQAIKNALHGPKAEPEQKQAAIGFAHD
jgi:hypothetical protein